MRRHSRHLALEAFTLVEVLVVVLLIAVLLGILLPGLMQARAAARRVQCAGRMRQIGVAVVSYGARHHVLPMANRNLVTQLAPDFGQLDSMTGGVTDVYRCPVDAFLPEADYGSAISYAPTENDRDDAAFLHCPWSLADLNRVQWLPPDAVAPDTVVLVEYWHGNNRANVGSFTPGWVQGTLDWTGAACDTVIRDNGASDVGGYLFLRAFDAQAEGLERSYRLTRLMHTGRVNVVRADGSTTGLNLKNVTRTSPADYLIWTRAAD